MRKVTKGTIWICYSSHTNCMSHILRQVSAERKVLFKTHFPHGSGTWLVVTLSTNVMTLLQVHTKIREQSYLRHNQGSVKPI